MSKPNSTSESLLSAKSLAEQIGETPTKRYLNCRHCGYETAPSRWSVREKRWRHTSECQACRDFKHKYGFNLTHEDRAILNAEPYCGICQATDKLHIDHCHATNKIRGYLCRNCNTSIGLLNEEVFRLAKAIVYLTKHNDPPTD